MAQVLDIRPLRVAGQRAAEQQKVYVGLLRVGRHEGRRSLSLVNSQGELQLGPLLDPVFAMADFDGLVQGGKEPETGLPQEWQVISERRLEGLSGASALVG
jgi:hypothetical protein